MKRFKKEMTWFVRLAISTILFWVTFTTIIMVAHYYFDYVCELGKIEVLADQQGWTDEFNEQYDAIERNGWEIAKTNEVYAWCIVSSKNTAAAVRRDSVIFLVCCTFLMSTGSLVFCGRHYYLTIVRARRRHFENKDRMEKNARYYRNITTR